MRGVLVGLDLNGRADMAARDQDLGDPDIRLAAPIVISGGVNGDVVTLGDPDDANGRHTRHMRKIAGPQAELAPHGRGDGWGGIGRRDRRRKLSRALDNPADDHSDEDIRAAITALARGARDVVLTVPDLATFDEAQQGRLLRASRFHRGPKVRLLWRSVAAFLDLLATDQIPRDEADTSWDILVHGPQGIEIQRLTLVSDRLHDGHVAPRRDGPGRRVLPEVGLDTLFRCAEVQVKAANSHVVWERSEDTRLGTALLTGRAQPGETEILRTWNATWTAVRAPALDPRGLIPSCLSLPEPRETVIGAFLVTPLQGGAASTLAERLGRIWPGLRVVGQEAIARGALRAGRLIDKGLPHYFDRIEPIRIAAQREGEPEFVDLIGPDVVVPADREYVSPQLDDFVWMKDKTKIEFYILKALLRKSSDGRAAPFPGQTYPTASVTGMPSAVKPLRTATRTWNSAT